MERILLLIKAEHAFDAKEALQSARKQAAGAKRLSFGLLTDFEPKPQEMAWLVTLGTVQYMAPTDDPWSDAASLWQGEDFILRLSMDTRLLRGWDMALINALRACPGRSEGHSVLTGLPPEPTDPVDAVYPLAAESLDEKGVLQLCKGIPLRYASRPERAAWMNPDFLFGPSAFWREMASGEKGTEPNLQAYRLGWTLYTLHTPCVQMICSTPLPCFAMQRDESYEQAFMLLDAGRLTPQARLGLFTTNRDFELNIPRPVRMQQGVLRALRSHSGLAPLVVTRFCTDHGPDGHRPQEDYTCFRLLAQIQDVPLLCFADEESKNRLLPVTANVLSYKRRYEMTLPPEAIASRAQRVALSKVQLMATAREKQLNHTHYIWMNRGILRYPVAPFASPDWAVLCQSRIVLATVNGVPDPSMIVVPQLLMPNLAREFAAHVSAAVKDGRVPAEEEIWNELIRDWPDAVQPVELPQRGTLIDLLWLPRGTELMTRRPVEREVDDA